MSNIGNNVIKCKSRNNNVLEIAHNLDRDLYSISEFIILVNCNDNKSMYNVYEFFDKLVKNKNINKLQLAIELINYYMNEDLNFSLENFEEKSNIYVFNLKNIFKFLKSKIIANIITEIFENMEFNNTKIYKFTEILICFDEIKLLESYPDLDLNGILYKLIKNILKINKNYYKLGYNQTLEKIFRILLNVRFELFTKENKKFCNSWIKLISNILLSTKHCVFYYSNDTTLSQHQINSLELLLDFFNIEEYFKFINKDKIADLFINLLENFSQINLNNLNYIKKSKFFMILEKFFECLNALQGKLIEKKMIDKFTCIYFSEEFYNIFFNIGYLIIDQKFITNFKNNPKIYHEKTNFCNNKYYYYSKIRIRFIYCCLTKKFFNDEIYRDIFYNNILNNIKSASSKKLYYDYILIFNIYQDCIKNYKEIKDGILDCIYNNFNAFIGKNIENVKFMMSLTNLIKFLKIIFLESQRNDINDDIYKKSLKVMKVFNYNIQNLRVNGFTYFMFHILNKLKFVRFINFNDLDVDIKFYINYAFKYENNEVFKLVLNIDNIYFKIEDLKFISDMINNINSSVFKTNKISKILKLIRKFEDNKDNNMKLSSYMDVQKCIITIFEFYKKDKLSNLNELFIKNLLRLLNNSNMDELLFLILNIIYDYQLKNTISYNIHSTIIQLLNIISDNTEIKENLINSYILLNIIIYKYISSNKQYISKICFKRIKSYISIIENNYKSLSNINFNNKNNFELLSYLNFDGKYDCKNWKELENLKNANIFTKINLVNFILQVLDNITNNDEYWKAINIILLSLKRIITHINTYLPVRYMNKEMNNIDDYINKIIIKDIDFIYKPFINFKKILIIKKITNFNNMVEFIIENNKRFYNNFIEKDIFITKDNICLI